MSRLRVDLAVVPDRPARHMKPLTTERLNQKLLKQEAPRYRLRPHPKQRYLLVMDPNRSGPDELKPENLVTVYELAEALHEAVPGSSPDWCQIARDAHQLARMAEALCRQLTAKQ